MAMRHIPNDISLFFSISDGALQEVCTPCPLGSYTSSTGSTSCSPCPDGAFANSTGTTNCYVCPTNQVPTLDKSGCQVISATGGVLGCCRVQVQCVCRVLKTAPLVHPGRALRGHKLPGSPLTVIQGFSHPWLDVASSVKSSCCGPTTMTDAHSVLKCSVGRRDCIAKHTVVGQFFLFR